MRRISLKKKSVCVGIRRGRFATAGFFELYSGSENIVFLRRQGRNLIRRDDAVVRVSSVPSACRGPLGDMYDAVASSLGSRHHQRIRTGKQNVINVDSIMSFAF